MIHAWLRADSDGLKHFSRMALFSIDLIGERLFKGVSICLPFNFTKVKVKFDVF